MKQIKQLDSHTINQIAAGEVIEDPSSVVKELTENAIDSNASHIVIKIENSGKSRIEILDNGSGMSIEDMKLCYRKHTTSKITTAHDITSVETMGFRGEGLASIASVSKLNIKSKLADNDKGYEIRVENSEVTYESVCAFPTSGTKVIVEDLFYNIPARKRFLDTQKDTRITKQIMDLVQRLSLSQPHIRFEFFVGSEKMYQSNGNGNIQHIIANVYNSKLAKNLIYVDTEVYGVKVKGYISRPEDCVGNRTKQTFFVNNRFIQMTNLSQALRTAYNSFAVSKKHAICVLFLEVDEKQVDVNVHPRKIEVRFQHNVFPVIISAVKGTLHNHRSALNVGGNNNQSNYNNTTLHRNDSSNKVPLPTNYKETITPFTPMDTNVENELEKTLSGDTETPSPLNDNVSEQQDIFNTEVQEEQPNIYKDYSNIKAIGQIMNSYIIANYDNGMIMIDQHAAHERILYEQYMKKFNQEDIHTTEMLLPLSINLDSSEYLSVVKQFDFFQKFGFVLEDFGHNTIIVREYPNLLQEKQVESVIKTMVEEFLSNDNESILTSTQHEKIIMRSCKDAIKANMFLNQLQMDRLIDDLSKCDNPYHCPHGRPVMINYNQYEIEKMFNRIV